MSNKKADKYIFNAIVVMSIRRKVLLRVLKKITFYIMFILSSYSNGAKRVTLKCFKMTRSIERLPCNILIRQTWHLIPTKQSFGD